MTDLVKSIFHDSKERLTRRKYAVILLDIYILLVRFKLNICPISELVKFNQERKKFHGLGNLQPRRKMDNQQLKKKLSINSFSKFAQITVVILYCGFCGPSLFSEPSFLTPGRSNFKSGGVKLKKEFLTKEKKKEKPKKQAHHLLKLVAFWFWPA